VIETARRHVAAAEVEKRDLVKEREDALALSSVGPQFFDKSKPKTFSNCISRMRLERIVASASMHRNARAGVASGSS
jgi:hypothetical protein